MRPKEWALRSVAGPRMGGGRAKRLPRTVSVSAKWSQLGGTRFYDCRSGQLADQEVAGTGNLG